MFVASFSSVHAADGIIQTDELRKSLHEQHASLQNVQVELVQSHYVGHGTAVMPERGPQQTDLVYRTRHTATVSHERYRLETEFLESALVHQVGMRTVATWDGVEARTLTVDGPLAETPGKEFLKLDVDFHARPTMAHYAESYLSLLGWSVLQHPGMMSYADWLDVDGVTGPELMSDGTSRWVCPMPGSNDRSEVVLIASRAQGRIALVRAELNIYKNGHQGDRDRVLIQPHVVKFGPLQEIDGAIIPSEITVYQQQFHSIAGHDAEDVWGFDKVTVIGAKKIRNPEKSHFRIAVGINQTIIDSRYRIVYEHGKTSVNLDGRLLSVSEPLRGDVGANLEWWVEHGTLGPIGSHVAESNPPAGGSSPSANEDASGSAR